MPASRSQNALDVDIQIHLHTHNAIDLNGTIRPEVPKNFGMGMSVAIVGRLRADNARYRVKPFRNAMMPTAFGAMMHHLENSHFGDSRQ